MGCWYKFYERLWSVFFSKSPAVTENIGIEQNDDIMVNDEAEPAIPVNIGIEQNEDIMVNDEAEPAIPENIGIEQNEDVMVNDEAEPNNQMAPHERADIIEPINENVRVARRKNNDPDFVPSKRIVFIGRRFRPERVVRAPIRFGDYVGDHEIDE